MFITLYTFVKHTFVKSVIWFYYCKAYIEGERTNGHCYFFQVELKQTIGVHWFSVQIFTELKLKI